METETSVNPILDKVYLFHNNMREVKGLRERRK